MLAAIPEVLNDVDTRPITVAANLEIVRCLPDCCGHMSPPCSLPFPRDLTSASSVDLGCEPTSLRAHYDLLPFVSHSLLYSYLSQLWQLMFSTFALPEGDRFLLSFGLFFPGGVV